MGTHADDGDSSESRILRTSRILTVGSSTTLAVLSLFMRSTTGALRIQAHLIDSDRVLELLVKKSDIEDLLRHCGSLKAASSSATDRTREAAAESEFSCVIDQLEVVIGAGKDSPQLRVAGWSATSHSDHVDAQNMMEGLVSLFHTFKRTSETTRFLDHEGGASATV